MRQRDSELTAKIAIEARKKTVFEFFLYSNWIKMTPEKKLEVLQGLADLQAEILKFVPIKVESRQLEGRKCGEYKDSKDIIENRRIYINEDLLKFNRFKGDLIESPSINAILMQTVYHESFHAYQRDIIRGYVTEHQYSQKTVESWNDSFEFYIESDDRDYYHLYPIQAFERDAFKYAEEQTLESFERIGNDSGFRAYCSLLRYESYEVKRNFAQRKSGGKNPEKYADRIISKYKKEYVKEMTKTEKSNPKYEIPSDSKKCSSDMPAPSQSDKRKLNLEAKIATALAEQRDRDAKWATPTDVLDTSKFDAKQQNDAFSQDGMDNY